ncbi:alpha/beta fold hydrolase [Bacillus sp. FJAT-28004]|uniref:alpha/beta fold hydrolase n=1 Tax=Bacillus sp. FJAT-28004 TaxID=1679165 RepID=UPI0006B45539|nr:alpha/beta hydrolase [Bacillus sp. FJAT-28004]
MNKQVNAQEKIGFVFINGAGLEKTIWHQLVSDLRHPYLLIDFPHRKGSDALRKELSLADYVNHMKSQIEGWAIQRFVIVAHSLGGALAFKLASELQGRVVGFVAIGAIIPKNGGSFLSTLPFPKRLLMSMILQKTGTKPPKSAILAGLCNDLSPEQSSRIVEGFVPESIRVYTDRIEAAAPAVLKLYVKLTKDKELSPSLQNKMILHFKPHSVQSLATGHLPMLSDPLGVKLLLQNFIEQVEL